MFQNETLVREVSKIRKFSLRASMVSIGTGTQFYGMGSNLALKISAFGIETADTGREDALSAIFEIY